MNQTAVIFVGLTINTAAATDRGIGSGYLQFHAVARGCQGGIAAIVVGAGAAVIVAIARIGAAAIAGS